MVGTVLSTTLLAAIVTKVVDLCRKFDSKDNPKLKPLWQVLSIGFGVLIALLWHVNGLVEAGIASGSHLQGVAGEFLTGALIGGFGSGWHELFDALSSGAKKSRATADAVRAGRGGIG